MTKRADIPKRLIYTCNCGFVDLSHASPDMAFQLLVDVGHERDLTRQFRHPSEHYTIEGRPAFLLKYRQGMGPWGTKLVGEDRYFLVRKGLPRQRKQEVALAIFIEGSLAFEAMQTGFWGFGSDSGFSAEDLMSDLIGFHMALTGLSEPDMRRLCGEVSERAALDVYDKHFPEGIGKVKERRFFEPHLFPCTECKGKQQMPGVFRALRPADQNGDYIMLDKRFVYSSAGLPSNFDRTGRPQGVREAIADLLRRTGR
jgi:hypothetical protein